MDAVAIKRVRPLRRCVASKKNQCSSAPLLLEEKKKSWILAAQ